MTLEEAAGRLGFGKMTVLRSISAGVMTARQVCKGAPLAVPEAQITALASTAAAPARPRTVDPDQKVMGFQWRSRCCIMMPDH